MLERARQQLRDLEVGDAVIALELGRLAERLATPTSEADMVTFALQQRDVFLDQPRKGDSADE